jgi:hypothetical protein
MRLRHSSLRPGPRCRPADSWLNVRGAPPAALRTKLRCPSGGSDCATDSNESSCLRHAAAAEDSRAPKDARSARLAALERGLPPSHPQNASARQADGISPRRFVDSRPFAPIRVNRFFAFGIWSFFGFWVLVFGASAAAAINLPCKSGWFPLSQPLFPQTRVL